MEKLEICARTPSGVDALDKRIKPFSDFPRY